MTEEEWLTATDPGPMLEFVRGKTSDRKLRLFAVACCRRVSKHLWTGRIGQDASEVAERYADGLATIQELAAYRALVRGHLDLDGDEPEYDPSYWACGTDIQQDVAISARYAANNFAADLSRSDKQSDDGDALFNKRWKGESSGQSALLRDLISPILFKSVTSSPPRISLTVISLGRAIYDNRQLPSGLFDNHRLAILADALEETGCDNADILHHLRGGGPHVRGCWVVDSILGKE